MSSYYWIKLHHEVLDDPKMGRMPDALWRRAIELFLLAGEEHEAGFLPAFEDMVWRLHTTDQVLEAELARLSEYGIVEQRDGRWFVTNFAKRQEPSTSTKRSQQHRARKRHQAYACVPDGETPAGEQDETLAADDCPQESATDQGRERDADGTIRPADIELDKEIDKELEQQHLRREDAPPPDGGQKVRDPPLEPAQKPAAHKSKRLTKGQRQFLELFGAKRYHNPTQKKTILALEQAHGRERLLDKALWAAKTGMSLGKAVVAVETAFRNERSQNGHNGRQSAKAGPRQEKEPGCGIKARPDEELQRGLKREQMDAKLASLERTGGGARASPTADV